MSEDLQAQFDEHRGGEEGLNRQKAYLALCMLGHNPTLFEIDQFYEGKEKSGEDDCLCFEEFEELVGSLGDPKTVLEDAFNFFDKSGNGELEADELKEILRMASKVSGMAMEDEELDEKVTEVIAAADQDGSGTLNIQELIAAIQSHQVDM